MKLFVSVTTLIFILFVWPFVLVGNGEVKYISYAQSIENTGAYSCNVQQNDTGGWYYSVSSYEKTLILQKSIPAISGNIAFSDSLEASLVAKLVLSKLESGIFPPSVRLSEIDSLHIYY